MTPLPIIFFFLLTIGFCIFFFRKKIQIFIDIQRCKKIIQKNSLTFYKAFSKIPDRKKRNAIFSVYAFCRYADDIVDEKKDEKKLLRLEKELLSFAKGNIPQHFRWRALKETTRIYYGKNYDYKPFFEMIEGQKRDLFHKDYKTLPELLDHCYLVAGTVGLMLLPILAPGKEKKLESFAINLGHAMQLTNILRDVGEDYQNGRIYLPIKLLQKYTYSKKDFSTSKNDIRFRKLFEEIAKNAEMFYKEALSRVNEFPKDSQLPLALSILLYRAILDACRKNNYDVFSKKNYVSTMEKEKIIKDYLQGNKV